MGGQARVREGVLGGQYIHQQTIWSINYFLSWNVKTTLCCVVCGLHVIELHCDFRGGGWRVLLLHLEGGLTEG